MDLVLELDHPVRSCTSVTVRWDIHLDYVVGWGAMFFVLLFLPQVAPLSLCALFNKPRTCNVSLIFEPTRRLALLLAFTPGVRYHTLSLSFPQY